MRILLALGAEPALKEEGKRIIAEAQKRRRTKERGEDVTPLGPSVDTRVELCKLAGTKNNNAINMVRFTEKKRKEGYWKKPLNFYSKFIPRKRLKLPSNISR